MNLDSAPFWRHPALRMLKNDAMPLAEPTLPYAGDLTPHEAWRKLTDDPKAALIDVRTNAEWSYVGIPNLNEIDKEPTFLSWKTFPVMQVNADFVQRLKAEFPDPATPLLFLCRSGGRSKEAAIAMTRAGYGRCYNIVGGFEGDADGQRHRNTVGGWRRDGLPWVQT